MTTVVVNDDVDKQIALNNGFTVVDTRTGAAIPTGAIYLGAAGRGLTGVQKIEGTTRVETAQLAAQYASSGSASSQYGAASGGTSATSATSLSAKGIIAQTLAQYGLSDLADWAWNTYLSSGSTDYVFSQLPAQPAFQKRFPAYTQLAQSGNGISVSQYLNYEQTASQLAQQNGFPPGFVNQDMITKSLLGNVSTSELSQRFADANKVVNNFSSNDLDYLHKTTGLTSGDLAAYWIDPTHALPILENKMAAAQISGAAANAGTSLDVGTAQALGAQGVTQAQAAQGFGNIYDQSQLYSALPGGTGQTINQGQQVGAEFSTDPATALAVKNAAAARVATFQQGGSPTSSSTGFVGAGVARGE